MIHETIPENHYTQGAALSTLKSLIPLSF